MEQQVSLNGEQTEDQHVHSGAQSSLNVSGSGAPQQVLHSRCSTAGACMNGQRQMASPDSEL